MRLPAHLQLSVRHDAAFARRARAGSDDAATPAGGDRRAHRSADDAQASRIQAGAADYAAPLGGERVEAQMRTTSFFSFAKNSGISQLFSCFVSASHSRSFSLIGQ